MKLPKLFVALTFALALAAGSAFAADTTAPKTLTCCEKAAAEGKTCTHKCCVAAHRDGKSCEKCNPQKQDLSLKKKDTAKKAS